MLVVGLVWPSPAYSQTWEDHARRAAMLHAEGKFTAAEPAAQTALAEGRRHQVPEAALRSTRVLLALVHFRMHRLTEAESELRSVAAESERSGDRKTLEAALPALTVSLQLQGRFAEAVEIGLRALKAALDANGARHPSVAQAKIALSGVLRDQGEYQRAAELCEEVLATSYVPVLDINLISSVHHNLGTAYEAMERLTDAQRQFVLAISERERLLGPEHADLAAPLDNLASVLMRLNRHREAEEPARRALAIREKTLGPDHPDTALSLNSLAQLMSGSDRLAEALPLLQRVLEIYYKSLGPVHPRLAPILMNVGFVYFRQARFDEAEASYTRALAIRERSLGPGHPQVALTLDGLSTVALVQGNLREAEAHCQRALAILEDSPLRGTANHALALNNLGLVRRFQKRYREAQDLHAQAIQILERNGGHQMDASEMLRNLSVVHFSLREYTEADRLLRRAIGLREQAVGPSSRQLTALLEDHALVLRKLKRKEEAKAVEIRLRSFQPKPE
jgi:tetratricopeptide (TPR) repeat protein